MRKALRIFGLVAALLAVASFAGSSVAILHSHGDGAGQACQMCHVAHLPALEVAPAAHVDPPLLARVHVSAEDVFLRAAPVVSLSAPRAPPVQQ